jgi:septal ring factor EnvC (AmiA/AmiB activator)
MDIETRDVLTFLSILAMLASMMVVSRNARRATSVQTENIELTRIRDLRAELRETKQELDEVKGQVTNLTRQLVEANDAAMDAYRARAEMLRWARMPGMDMPRWLGQFDAPPEAIGGRIDT